MKHPLFITLVIASLAVSALTHANHGTNASTDYECCNPSTIRAIGNGQVQVNPDIAIIYTSITQDGTTATEALNKVDTILNSIENVLKQNNVPKSDIQTSYISVFPKYDFSTGNAVVVGYTVFLSLTVTVRGIDRNPKKVANIIEGLAMAGVNSVSSVSYDTSQPETAKSLARKLALTDAIRKGKEYAELTCQSVVRYLSVDETFASYSPFFTSSSGVLRATDSGSGMMANSSTMLELPTGKITIFVNVVVSWIVKPNKLCKTGI